jgi:hypothetical protein
MNDADSNALELAAYHGAGHVVARVYFGREASGVEISAGGTCQPHGGAGDWWGRNTTLDVLSYAATCLAGVAAQGKVMSVDARSLLASHWDDDAASVERSFAMLVEWGLVVWPSILRTVQEVREAHPKGYPRVPSKDHLWRAAWHLTEGLTRRHWREVERTATALLERSKLSAMEVAAVIGADIKGVGRGPLHRTARALSRALLTPWPGLTDVLEAQIAVDAAEVALKKLEAIDPGRPAAEANLERAEERYQHAMHAPVEKARRAR